MRKINKFRSLCKIADLLDVLYHTMSFYDDLTDDHDYQDDIDVIEEMCRKTNVKVYALSKEFDALLKQEN